MGARYVANAYEISDKYENVLLDAEDAKVKIEASSDNNTKMFFFEKKRRPYEFAVQGNTLVIKARKARWYNFLRIGINNSEIKLCVTNSSLESLSVVSNVGHIDVCSIACNGTINIRVNTGRLNLENVSCKALETKGNTGSVYLNNFVATENISIKRNTGKVVFNDCFAPEICVKTNTGAVYGRLSANMEFIVRTNTGKIETPRLQVGEAISGRCEIKTNTGNVKFE